jgi:hypothetical protein
MAQPIEFICADCKSHVFSYGGNPYATRCYNCTYIRNMDLSPEREAEMRRILDCEPEPEPEQKIKGKSSAKLGK